MTDCDWLVEHFEATRPHLRAVAFRMLGSASEADDAVQEAWLRLDRSDVRDVQNLGGWLTTVVARVCLDMLRSRKSRRERSLDEHGPEPVARRESWVDPEHSVRLADSVGPALLLVLDALEPAERVAFVLHDVFDLPFEEIAAIVGRTSGATRQLASRARRRIRGAGHAPTADLARQQRVADAYLAAARDGDFDALLAVLDPDVVLRTDRAAAQTGQPSVARGAAAVARRSMAFSDRARVARVALVDGAVGVIVAPHGSLLVVLALTISHGRIAAIDVIADPEGLRRLRVAVLDG